MKRALRQWRVKWASEFQGLGRAQSGDVIAEQWRAESGPANTESTGTCSGDKRRRSDVISQTDSSTVGIVPVGRHHASVRLD